MKKDVNKEALNALQETVEGMHRIGLINDARIKVYEKWYKKDVTSAKPKKTQVMASSSYTPPIAAYATGAKH
ncbi:MAG: hypothetical protein LBM77_11770 [Spirochaetaceae bacterium]|jgi:hypothetical protein|nr:hypothetical protein [Spirochaetaceae bacterium]